MGEMEDRKEIEMRMEKSMREMFGGVNEALERMGKRNRKYQEEMREKVGGKGNDVVSDINKLVSVNVKLSEDMSAASMLTLLREEYNNMRREKDEMRKEMEKYRDENVKLKM